MVGFMALAVAGLGGWLRLLEIDPVHQFRGSIQTTWLPACQQIDERLGQLIEAVPVLLDDAKSALPDPLPELLKRLMLLLLGILEDAESLQPRALPHHARASLPSEHQKSLQSTYVRPRLMKIGDNELIRDRRADVRPLPG